MYRHTDNDTLEFALELSASRGCEAAKRKLELLRKDRNDRALAALAERDRQERLHLLGIGG